MSASTLQAARAKRGVERAKRAAIRREAKLEREQRGKERRFLALQIGMHILNELEHYGAVYIRSYLRVRPKSVINWYNELDSHKSREVRA